MIIAIQHDGVRDRLVGAGEERRHGDDRADGAAYDPSDEGRRGQRRHGDQAKQGGANAEANQPAPAGQSAPCVNLIE